MICRRSGTRTSRPTRITSTAVSFSPTSIKSERSTTTNPTAGPDTAASAGTLPRARTACAPIRLQPKRPRGTLLLESNSAARLGPTEQRWHAAPARQLSSFAHLPPGSARHNGKCVDGIPFPTGMTCCKAGDRNAISDAVIRRLQSAPEGDALQPPTLFHLGSNRQSLPRSTRLWREVLMALTPLPAG